MYTFVAWVLFITSLAIVAVAMVSECIRYSRSVTYHESSLDVLSGPCLSDADANAFFLKLCGVCALGLVEAVAIALTWPVAIPMILIYKISKMEVDRGE